jgi:hypothetical protein
MGLEHAPGHRHPAAGHVNKPPQSESAQSIQAGNSAFRWPTATSATRISNVTTYQRNSLFPADMKIAPKIAV